MGQHVVAGVVRLILFAIVGIGGWMIGGTIGAFAGVGLDLLLIGERAPEFGVAVSPFFWIGGWLGAIGGAAGSVMWLAINTGHGGH